MSPSKTRFSSILNGPLKWNSYSQHRFRSNEHLHESLRRPERSRGHGQNTRHGAASGGTTGGPGTTRRVVLAVEVIGSGRRHRVGLVGGQPRIDAGRGSSVEPNRVKGACRKDHRVSDPSRDVTSPTRGGRSSAGGIDEPGR